MVYAALQRQTVLVAYIALRIRWHIASMARDRGLCVWVTWVPSHVGVEGNEVAESIARWATFLPFVIHPGLSRDDFFVVFGRDYEAWCRLLCTYVGSVDDRADYFNRVSFNSPKPWFRGLRFPRSYLTLITRLRTSHVCDVINRVLSRFDFTHMPYI